MEEDTIEYELLRQIKFTLDCGNEALAIRMIEQFAFHLTEDLYTEEETGELITKVIKKTSQYCNINKLYGDTIEQFSKEWFNENKKK